MAHELDIRNGKAAMAYIGDKPWHGLGQELTAGASIETWIKEAGMNYAIGAAPVAFSADGKTMQQFGGKNVLFRDDTNEPLGLVSDSYQVVQPREIMEFFDDVAELHGFELETAGVLFGGKKYWALARTPKELSLGKDKIKSHLMLATACDGSMSTIAKYVMTRVVCNNTIQMALGEQGSQVKVRHNTRFAAENVKKELGLFSDSWQKMEETVRGIAKRTVTTEEAIKYLVAVLGDPERPIEDQFETPNIAHVLGKFESGNYLGGSMKSADHTAWGLVNCVTEWLDHGRGRGQDRRLEYSWFGAGSDLKQKAFDVAAAMI